MICSVRPFDINFHVISPTSPLQNLQYSLYPSCLLSFSASQIEKYNSNAFIGHTIRPPLWHYWFGWYIYDAIAMCRTNGKNRRRAIVPFISDTFWMLYFPIRIISCPMRRTNTVLLFFVVCPSSAIILFYVLVFYCPYVVCVYMVGICGICMCVTSHCWLGCYKSYVIVACFKLAFVIFFFLALKHWHSNCWKLEAGYLNTFFIICRYVVVANHLLSFAIIVFFYLPCVLLCSRWRYYMLLFIQSLRSVERGFFLRLFFLSLWLSTSSAYLACVVFSHLYLFSHYNYDF